MTGTDGVRPAALYDYLATARQKLLDFVRPLTSAQYAQEFPFGQKTIRATLVHVAAAEWMYNRRLLGASVPPPADRPFTRFSESEFAPFAAAWQVQSEETRRTLREITDWSRPVEYLVTPPPPGAATVVLVQRPTRIRTTAGGIAAQLLFHEIHHRAQVMAMLRHLGLAAQNLDYSALMFERIEVPE